MVERSPILIYILGASRSGSTILDALLGSHPDVAATGELYLLLKDEHGQPRTCACGEAIPDCEFWGPILAAWREALQPADLADYVRLQDRYERFRTLGILSWDAARNTRRFRTYSEWTARLVELVGEQASVGFIADSSKHPPRALATVLGGQVKVFVIHLLRDPRAVVWSKMKILRSQGGPAWYRSPAAIAIRTSLDWALANLSAEVVGKTRPEVRQFRVRYEDVVDDPRAALGRLGEVVGIDLSTVGRRAKDGGSLQFAHIMAGSPARRRGSQPLRKDVEWQAAAPSWAKVVAWILAGWLARAYGYRW
jgi:hypothetical protein